MAQNFSRLTLYALVLPFAFGLAIASTVAPMPFGERTLDVELPSTTSEEEEKEYVGNDGPLSLRLSRSVVSFGALRPGESSQLVDLKITNTGLVPMTFEVAASDMVEPSTGAVIAADRIHVSTSPSRAGVSLADGGGFDDLVLSPASSATLYLVLHTPSGSAQYLPAGDYAGTIRLSAKGVGS